MNHACAACGRTTTRPGRCTLCARAGNQAKNQRPTAAVYQSQRWRTLRTAVLQRDGQRCQQCGAPATHAAHRTPFADANDPHAWDMSNVEAQCAQCNGREAGHRRHQKATA